MSALMKARQKIRQRIKKVMAKKIVFVCHGNICRSPAAEFIFRKLAAEKHF